MKLTPSSTARRKTFFAHSRSGGQPQIPSPVNRIAPNPSRLTKRSLPNKNVSFVVFAAARNFGKPPVRTPAAPAEITPKNVLRLIAGKICCCYERSSTSPTESVEQRNPQSSALPPTQKLLSQKSSSRMLANERDLLPIHQKRRNDIGSI